MSWPEVHCEAHVFSVSPQKVPASRGGQREVFPGENCAALASLPC